MSNRTIETVTHVTPQPGSGILHPFPTAELPHIDPFVFLDTGAPLQLGSNDIYVGPHPHRGVQPVSLLFRGRIEHRDSLGTHKTVTSGGMQWLVSGSGALHEEVLNGDDDGVFHMAQLWINVPERLKMVPPEHHAVAAESIPALDGLGDRAVVRLYAGTIGGIDGPAPMPTPVLVAHVDLDPGGSVVIPITANDDSPSWNAAVMVVDGAMQSDETELSTGTTAVFAADGDSIELRSQTGGQALLMAGEPIGEPIAMGGGFVMTTDEQIQVAFDDYRTGRMGELTASR